MATCKIDGCGHSVRRSADNKQVGWSWNNYGICVCCATSLSELGTILNKIRPLANSRGCNKAIELEVQYPNKAKMVRNRIG